MVWLSGSAWNCFKGGHGFDTNPLCSEYNMYFGGPQATTWRSLEKPRGILCLAILNPIKTRDDRTIEIAPLGTN